MSLRLLSLSPFLFALSLGLGCASSHAQQAIMLQQKMGPAEFSQAGLDKLDPAELQHLQQWLADHAAELAALVPASATASARVVADRKPAGGGGGTGHQADSADRKVGRIVVSPIAGHFEGWRRGSVLTLQNGQQWRVSDDSSLATPRPVDSPEATVKPGAFGGWLLKVKGYNASARVEPAN